ncbi:MAG: protein-methionine-sulfoxide reductase catalytic subunit MsrP [Anaerolineae bacterium]
MKTIRSSEITPEHVYWSRRRFMKGAAKLLAGSAVLAACRSLPREQPQAEATPTEAGTAQETAPPAPTPAEDRTDELGTPLTPYASVTGFNNYYEFTLQQDRVAEVADGFVTSPWAVEVGGLVNNPKTYDLDDLRAFEIEERIYRLRCVEAWSMVVPWMGFPLSRLLREVEPTSRAQYVRFETVLDEEQMPGLSRSYPWPYVEGLRLDEAMHDLTLMATGVYGRDLPPQNGAPIRLVVPWKYGLKSIKSIVKIELVEEMPETFWMKAGPNEYGFWSNVNPEVPHPRWSQATERLIGANRRKETLYFNGYAEEVAELYDNLDSEDWYR